MKRVKLIFNILKLDITSIHKFSPYKTQSELNTIQQVNQQLNKIELPI